MRTSTGFGGAVAVVLAIVCSFGTFALAQDTKKPDAPGAGAGARDQAAEMEMWQKYATPGKEHQMLKDQFAGNWDVQVKHLMGPGETTTGTAKYDVVMDGRYLAGTFDGKAMGQPFKGMSLTGYDNATKKFFNTWVDTMGTGLLVTQGTYDPSTKTYTFSGDMTMPNGQTTKVREVVKVESNDKHVFEMYMTGPQGEMKAMEITYTRKK